MSELTLNYSISAVVIGDCLLAEDNKSAIVSSSYVVKPLMNYLQTHGAPEFVTIDSDLYMLRGVHFVERRIVLDISHVRSLRPQLPPITTPKFDVRVHEDYAIVPRRPTKAMLEAIKGIRAPNQATKIWRAMIAESEKKA